jgi:hypothetical protein
MKKEKLLAVKQYMGRRNLHKMPVDICFSFDLACVLTLGAPANERAGGIHEAQSGFATG